MFGDQLYYSIEHWSSLIQTYVVFFVFVWTCFACLLIDLDQIEVGLQLILQHWCVNIGYNIINRVNWLLNLNLFSSTITNTNGIYNSQPTIRPMAHYRVINNQKEQSVKTNQWRLKSQRNILKVCVAWKCGFLFNRQNIPSTSGSDGEGAFPESVQVIHRCQYQLLKSIKITTEKIEHQGSETVMSIHTAYKKAIR